jgi:hypothetical protein
MRATVSVVIIISLFYMYSHKPISPSCLFQILLMIPGITVPAVQQFETQIAAAIGSKVIP